MTTLAMVIPPDVPPELFVPAAQAAEQAGLEEVWLWEDCFAESGIAAAATILASTTQLRVGIGLLPVPLRNVALTAMELATIERLHPGRCLPGIGHGVLDWMGQAGARVESPVTLLREYGTTLRRLLDGETVTTSGRYVTLDTVALRWPLSTRMPLYVGGRGPRTLEIAALIGDGIILDGDVDQNRGGLEHVRTVREGNEVVGGIEVVSFVSAPDSADADELHERVAAHVAAGTTRAAVLGVSRDGPPDGSEKILHLAAQLGRVRERL